MESTTESAPTETPHGDEPVWTFRGYRMRPAEFNTAMVHFYRAEIQRANTWRNRLDATTNWAIITTGAVITFVLSEPTHHHAAILLNILLVFVFLYIEARRYRYFELWSYRTRLMETEFFAPMLVPPYCPSPEWAESLARSLRKPELTISVWEAVGRRFRRNYFAIAGVLIVVWLFKLYVHPQTAQSFAEFSARAQIGALGGEAVLGAMAALVVFMSVMALATARLQEARGEVLDDEAALLARFRLSPRARGGNGEPGPLN